MSVSEALSPDLSQEQQNLVEALVCSLSPGQALWLSGYFAGFARGSEAQIDERKASSIQLDVRESSTSTRQLTILFGSETGNSAALAAAAAHSAREAGLHPTAVDMADYKTRLLKNEDDLLIITSTHGEGDPPQSAKAFFEFLESRKAPNLKGKRFAVVALGDSTYEHFCGAGKRLDRRLEELGATRIAPRVDCDVDYDVPAADAIAHVLGRLIPHPVKGGTTEAITRPVKAGAPVRAVFDKRNPYPATVLDNFVLTDRGSTKEIRHVELSTADSGITFEPGDALGVLPRNDPRVVEAILASTSLPADARVVINDERSTLSEALASRLEIVQGTPRLIDLWAELSDSKELRALRGESQAEARTTFLRCHHVIDILRQFPVKGIDAQTLVAGLRPLQPRLYSIASSQSFAPDEVHLTISVVRYDLSGNPRTGVASGFFADRAAPETRVPVYVQSNPHFRLPGDDVPIVMIGAGTGIAPYRAFLQERESRSASGKNWLLFGARNFHTDFLYQIEWQELLKSGLLTRMNVAFSRDRIPKSYVQHRLLEHAHDVYAWLENGAHVYVCGDATRLAPDVHAALRSIIQKEGGLEQSAADDYLASLQRNRRYQIDVY